MGRIKKNSSACSLFLKDGAAPLMIEQLQTLSPEKRQVVLSFLDERFHKLLDENYTILLAPENNAIALFRIIDQHFLEVPLFFVSPEHESKGLFLSLLQHIETYAREHQCKGIALIYQTENPIFEELLEELHWGEPEYNKIRCTFYLHTFKAPWLHYAYPLPAGYEIFPWKDLKTSERDHLKAMLNHNAIPFQVSPFKDEHLIEPLNSFGLRYHGKIVGWLITHRTSPDMIKYVSFWTFPEHRSFGTNVKMLADAIRIHMEHKILWGETEANYIQVDHRWIRFFEKRLAPYSEKVVYFYRSFKTL